MDSSILYILLCIVSLAFTAKEGVTREHTNVITTMLLQQGIYIPQTYGGRLGVDPCTPVSNREAFIRLLASCQVYLNDITDYDLEHMVEQSNTPYTQNKNIAGNLVFALASWNRAVGQLNWTSCAHEKRMVYGAIFDEAINHVVKCGESVDVQSDDTFVIAIVSICLLGVAIGLMIAFVYIMIDRQKHSSTATTPMPKEELEIYENV